MQSGEPAFPLNFWQSDQPACHKGERLVLNCVHSVLYSSVYFMWCIKLSWFYLGLVDFILFLSDFAPVWLLFLNLELYHTYTWVIYIVQYSGHVEWIFFCHHGPNVPNSLNGDTYSRSSSSSTNVYTTIISKCCLSSMAILTIIIILGRNKMC